MNYREKTKSELINELEVLKQEFEAFKTAFNRDVAEREKLEFSLGERMKELRCHNEITTILCNANFTLDDVVEKITQIIPDSMRFPEIAGVGIKIYDKVFKTQNFVKSNHTLRQQISSNFKIVGHLEVSYAEALLPPVQQIFLPEETDLLFSVAQRIGGFIEKMERENTLIQNHTTLQKLIETINDVIYEISADNVIKYVSPSIEKLVGYKPDELIGESFLKFVYQPDLAIVLESFALLPGIIFPYIEYRFVAKNGSLCWIRSSASVIFENGKIVGVTGSITNITHQKQIETELQTSESLYRSILNASPDVITITDLDGKIQFASPRALEMFGYDKIETLYGCSILEFIKPEFHDKANYGISKMLEGNLTGAEEYVAIRQDGSTFNVEINSEFVRDEHGKPQKMIFVTRDISDRKMAEEKIRNNEERFRYLVESIKDVIYEIDSDGSIKYVSPSINQIIGYDQNELIGRNFLEVTHPDDRSALINAFKNLQSRDYPYFEYRLIAKDGSVRWVRSSTTAVFKDGKMIGGNGSMTDITEWKIAKDALAEREEKFRNIFEGLQDAYYESSLDGTILEISPSIEILSNGQYTRHDLIGKSLSGLYADLDDRNSIIAELKKHGRVTDYEVLMRNKDGSFVPAAISASLLFDANKNPLKISGNLRNITERKQAEKALRQSNQKWEAIIAASPDGIGVVSLDGKIQLVSDKLALMYGYGAEEKDEFIGKAVNDFIDPSFHKMMEENIDKFILGETNHQITEYLAIKKDNSRFYVELSSTVLFDHNGKSTNILYVQRDTTDRKKSETAIQESEKKFRNIFETMQDTYYEASIDGNLLEVSPSIEMLSKGQYQRDELIGKSFIGIYAYPEDRNKFISELFKNGNVSDFELMLSNKDGSLVPVSISSRVLFDAEGKPVKIAGSIRDITKRKKAEEALRESEMLYKAILNASPDDITITDLNGTILFASPKALTMFGYETMEQMIGQHLNKFIIAEDLERAKSEIIKIQQGTFTGPADYRAIRANLTVFDIEVNGELMYDDDGEPSRMVFVVRDVTDRVTAELNLVESEEKFRTIAEQTSDFISISDSNGHITYASPASVSVFHIQPEAMIGSNFIGFVVESDIPRAIQTFVDCLENDSSIKNAEFKMKRADGTIFIAELNASKFQTGTQFGTLVTISDITERKLANEALIASEEKYRLMFFDNPQPMVIYDSETFAFLEVNEAAIKQYGYSRAEFLQLSIKDLHTPDDIANVIEDVELSKNNQNTLTEWKHFGKDKTRFDVELTSHSVNFEGRKARHVLINDITARKQAEEAVRVSSKKWEAIISASPDGIGMISLDGKVQLISEKLALMYGYSIEEKDKFLGKSVIDFIDSSDHKLLKENIRKLLSGTNNFQINEYIAIRKDKSRFFAELNSTVLFDSDGKPTNILYLQRDITDRKQAENELLQREELLDSIIETARDSIFIKDASLTYIKVNKAMASLFGMSKEEIAGKSDAELFGAESEDHAEEIDRQVLLGETVEEFPSKPVNGEIKHFHTIKVPLKDAHGQIYGLCGIARDITESKQAEKALQSSEERFRAISEYSSSSICILNTAGKVIWVNDAMLKMTGYTPEQVYSAESFTAFLAPESLDFVIPNFMKFVNHQDYKHHYEFSIIRADGEKRLCEKFMSHYEDQSGKLNLIISMTDITERHHAEQSLRNNRQELIASNNQLEMAQQIGRTGSWLYDIETQKIWGSSEAKRLFGFDKNEEYFTLDAIEACIPECERIHQALIDLINKEIPYDLEYELHPADGSSPKTILSKARAEKDEAGNIISIIGVIQDITDRVSAEQNLVESEEKFRTIAEQTSDFISLSNSNGQIIYASPASVSVFNVTPEDMIGRNFIGFVAESDAARAVQAFVDCLENDNNLKNAEFCLKRADGTMFTAELNASKFHTGTQFGTLVTIRDITERKNSETALQQSEKKFRSIFESIQDTYFEATLEGTLLEISPSIEIISKGQYTRDEMIGKPFAGIYTSPDIRNAYFSQLFNQKRVTDYELLLKNKDGSSIPVSVSAALSFDEEGKPVKITGSLRDITERKVTENALRDSEVRFRSITQQSSDLISITDAKGIITFASSAAESIFRISPREMYGKHFTEFLDEPFLSEAFTEFRIALSKGETTNNFEMRMKRNDGSKFFGEINGSKFQSGTQSGTLVTIRDITERKLAEEALMASEEKYRHLFYNNPQPMWIYDIETLAFLEVNQAAITHYGYSRNEFLSMTLRDIRPPEDIADLLKDVELSKNNQSTQIEWRHIRKNKELRIVEITAQSLIFNGRSARHVLIIDITERKQAEVALRKSEDDLNYAQEIAKMGSWEFNLKTGKVKWSKSYYLLIEQQPDGIEVPNDAFDKMVHPDDKHLIDEKLAEIYQNRKPATVDLRLIMPGGQIKWVQNNIVPEYDGDTLIALTGVNIDITEKKLAEQEIHDLNESLETRIIIRTIQLEETNEILENEIQSRMLVEVELALEKHRLSEIIEGTNVGTWEWNIQTGQAIFNERWAEIIGYTLDELAPVSIETWEKFAHPDDIVLSGQLMEKHFKGELAYYSFESRMKHKNGEWIWVLDRGKVHNWDMDHKPLMMSGTHQDITERKKASEFETELLQLSLQLTGIPSSEIAPALDMALQRIGGFLGADRAYIFEMNDAEKTMSNTFEWCNQGINPEIENLKDVPLEVFPAWLAHLQKHQNIIIQSVKDLPESWQAEREHLGSQGIQSLLAIPMTIENHLIGFVGLDSVTNKREYTASEINILRVWSNMLASLINHQRKEEFIEQTRRNYETFFNTIDDFLFVLDVQGNMIHTNTTVTRRLGYSTDELMEKSVLMVHPAERRGEAGRTVGEMLAGTAEFCPVPLVTKSGEYIPVETRVKHGFWDGRPAIFGVTKDVSQIKLSEEKFSKAFQFNSALMAISDINGQFLDVNDTFLKTLGFLREEVLGNNITPPNLFEDKEFVETINEKMKQGIPVREIESKVTTKSGEVRIGLFSADTIYIGKDLCLLTMMVDITERKQAEEKINQARDEAEKANRAKSEFLSRMSHELRTPMNSILGFAQLMEMGELNLSQKKGVKHILNSGKHLLNLINEVLDIARIEAGRVSLSMEPIHVGGVIMEMLDVMQPNAAKLNLKTELRNSPENKLFVVADHQRLKQVLLNLLANAFKYNISGGSVTVQTALMQKPESEIPVIRISISDTGRGISAENLPKLFQPFERIGAEKGETEGTGLGLTVVKKLIEIMGGTIGVESQPGIGSTFWIELPFAESQKNIAEQTEWALKQEEGFIKKAGTILYIEDNVSNIELVEQILTIQRPGNRLISNMTGGHAVSLAIEYKPDLILLDLDLPDIHGSEVLKNLQAEAKTNAIPVIIISADAMPERIQKLRTAGVKDYLTKPLDIVEFLRVVDEYIK